MTDLKSKPLIVLKGALFFAILAASFALLWLANPDWRTAFLLIVLVWSSARSYYFVFYVLERYVDPRLKYAGLTALVGELLRRARSPR